MVHASPSLACGGVDGLRRVETRQAARLMDFNIRHTDKVRAVGEARQCPQCRTDALILMKRHVSPPRLGAALVTEYYECERCDSRYQYSPASDSWKPIYQ
jgi:DNA-directed RNA polymerase subunit M/transcription elongation factor TFIIS